MSLGMLAALILASKPGDFGGNPELKQLASLPRDVRVHIDRQMGCNHWSGEEPYDAERRRQIMAAARELRCTSLERDEQRLRHRYASSPAVLKALTEYRDALW
jgi:hypothetical protein